MTRLFVRTKTKTLDCKTVGFFFLNISKESVKRGVRVLRARSARASLPSLALYFQPRSRPFVWLLARIWIRKNKDCFAVYEDPINDVYHNALLSECSRRKRWILGTKKAFQLKSFGWTFAPVFSTKGRPYQLTNRNDDSIDKVPVGLWRRLLWNSHQSQVLFNKFTWAFGFSTPASEQLMGRLLLFNSSGMS